jgi:ABC-2 type transport system ATP-binding protein
VVGDLLAVQNQTEVVLENAAPDLLDQITQLAQRSGARVVERRAPQTDLEQLFLDATQEKKSR